MGTHLVRVVGAGILFLLIFLAGYWLSRAGKPYNSFALTVHKLAAVAAIVLLVITLVRSNRTAALSAFELVAGVVTGAFFLSLVVTGGLLSIPLDREMPAIVRRLHQVAPYLTVLSTALTLYLLRGR